MYLGVDAGKRGSFVELSQAGNVISSYVMPLKEVKSKKAGKKTPDLIVDLKELTKLIYKFRGDLCVLEDIHSIFGADKSSMFKMGRVLGNIESLLECNGIKYVLIPPKQWQKAIWIPSDEIKVISSSGKTLVTDTKATSLNAAKRLFPEEEFLYGMNETQGRKKIPNNNIVDAALIALYAKQHYSK